MLTLRQLINFAMGTTFGGILTLSICIIYGFALHHLTGKRRDSNILLRAFAFVFILGWAIHLIAFIRIGGAGAMSLPDWAMAVYFSMQYSLEMFVGKTMMFKGSINSLLCQDKILSDTFVTVFYMAVITSALAIFHFISRIAYGRRWLHKNQAAATTGHNHIFLGICDASRKLAANIKRDGTDGKIIFIDIPNGNDEPKALSIWDIISQFFFNSENHEDLAADVVLRADRKMKGLVPWFRSSRNNVYILSDDQEENLKLLERLWQLESAKDKEPFDCHIYCHAVKEGLVSHYDTVADVHNRTTFVDSSFLAIESLKDPENIEMYPVNYVIPGTDPASGRKTGWVESAFNCAIIGFGETGQEALKFLYEFGAFAGKDKQKAPFRCHVFDKDPENAFGEFQRKIQPEDEDEIQFMQCATETSGFWNKLSELIPDINYVIVCLGDDSASLRLSIDIAEFALQQGRDLKDRFVIAVRQNFLSELDNDTLSKANMTFGNSIRPFGMSDDIWTLRVMENKHIDDMARKFYSGYMGIGSDEESVMAWKEREERLRHDDFNIRSKTRRQIAQDYSNCLHVITKRALCSPDTAKAACHILDNCTGGTHVDRSLCSKSDEAVLEYLAIGEHFRWNASHIMLGYRYAEETSDLKKTHNCLVPFSELDDRTRHYDWLVVRNSLRFDCKS